MKMNVRKGLLRLGCFTDALKLCSSTGLRLRHHRFTEKGVIEVFLYGKAWFIAFSLSI
jgi:hypothetical protein